MEVLVQVGSPQGLVAAVKGGCDAVYVNGDALETGMGFPDGVLEGAVEYAHSHGVKVYVAINTLVKNREMENAVSYVGFLSNIGADAVFITDLGLLANVKRFPISIHASIEMGIHSADGLRWCSENGISRAYLPKELTSEELDEITPDSPIETAVFVQGAMCQGLPGGCLMSSLLLGKSAIRGNCAQPCKWKYSSENGSGYLLCNADLLCIDSINRLKECHIDSVVIDGMARSPAYAYLASKVYSSSVDEKPLEEFEGELTLLKGMLNRGFCNGYLSGVVGIPKVKYPDGRGLWLGKATSENRKINFRNLGITPGDGVSLYRGDTKMGSFRTDTGGTAMVPLDLPDGTYDVYLSYDPRLNPIKNLIGESPEFRGKRKRPRHKIKMPVANRSKGAGELSFYVSSVKAVEAVAPYADRIYYDGLDYAGAIEAACGAEVVAVLPRFQPIRLNVPVGMPVMVHSPGQTKAYAGRKQYVSYSANMFNSFFPSDFEMITLSVELSRDEIRDVLQQYSGKVEQMVYGRHELMVTRDPSLKNGFLKDAKGYEFPVYRDSYGLARIINSSDTMLIDKLDELKAMGVDSFGIDLRKRPVALATKVAKAFRKGDSDARNTLVAMSGGGFNSGNYTKGV